ncbi:TolC family protein [Niabella sp. 22666]|uniref:TolC family protein n=1 Tax=Niabella sp. 22666 TaxID=3453954 RepID=UPI003F87E65B
MNRTIKALLLFSTALLSYADINAQDKRSLTLQEALELGIANSKNLKIDDAKIIEATAAIDEAKNRQLPDLKVSGSYLRLTNANINLKTGQQSSGGEGEAGTSAAPKVNQAMYGMANFSLPLFAGGRIKYGIQSAKYLLEAAKLNAGSDKNEIAYNISQAYVNLFKASQVVRVLNENLVTSQKRDADFLNKENNGIIARNDRLKAQLQTSDIELQLLEAENNYNIANMNMNLLLGLPEQTIIEVDSSFINQQVDVKTFSDYQQQALQNRKDVQALGFQQRAAELATKSAKAENLPTLALTGGYVAADIPNFLTVTNAVNAGVGIQYNLANLWKSNAVLKQSRARETQLTASKELLMDGVKLKINRDYQNAFVAKKKIEVYEKSERQAEENYRITKNKFDNSLVTITELLDANVALLSTKINVLNAKADAALAYRKLLETTGVLYQ